MTMPTGRLSADLLEEKPKWEFHFNKKMRGGHNIKFDFDKMWFNHFVICLFDQISIYLKRFKVINCLKLFRILSIVLIMMFNSLANF